MSRNDQQGWKSFADLRRALIKLGLTPKTHPDLFRETLHLEQVSLVMTQLQIRDTSKDLMARLRREHRKYYETRRDLAELKQRSRLLLQESQRRLQTDELTRLLRKAEFERQYRAYVRDMARDRRDRNERVRKWGVLWVLDLDRFKLINDLLGHGVGDRTLRLFSRMLHRSIRKSGSISGRIGGDEFAVLQKALKRWSYAIQIADRFKTRVRQANWRAIDERLELFRPEVSIGVAPFRLASIIGHQHEASAIADKWYAAADQLMYRAKEGQLSTIACKGFEWKDGELIETELDNLYTLEPMLDGEVDGIVDDD